MWGMECGNDIGLVHNFFTANLFASKHLLNFFWHGLSCQQPSFLSNKKNASDGNRRPVLTSETTKRKVQDQLTDPSEYFLQTR